MVDPFGTRQKASSRLDGRTSTELLGFVLRFLVFRFRFVILAVRIRFRVCVFAVRLFFTGVRFRG